MSELTDLIFEFAFKRKDPPVIGKFFGSGDTGGGGGGGGRGWVRPPKPTKHHRGKRPGWNPPPLPKRAPRPPIFIRKPPPFRLRDSSDVVFGDPYGRHIRLTPEDEFEFRDGTAVRASIDAANALTAGTIGSGAIASTGAIGGTDITASGTLLAAKAGIGTSHTLTGERAFAAGLAHTIAATATHSAAIGFFATAYIQHSLSHGTNAQEYHRAQYMRAVAANTSDTGETQPLYPGGPDEGNGPLMPDGSLWVMTGTIASRRDDGGEESAGWTFVAMAVCDDAGSATMLGSTVTLIYRDDAAFVATLAIINDNELEITVTSPAGYKCDHMCFIEIAEVKTSP